MGTLVLVRHAQASFTGEDYDQLSELGERQARALGHLWASRRMGADAVYSGPRRRQIRTALLAGAEVERAGLPWPEPKVLDALDEYTLDIKAAMTRLTSHPKVAPHLSAIVDARGEEAKKRGFHRALEAVMRLWAVGELEDPDGETWDDFKGRVSGAVSKMTAQKDAGRRVVAFTSAGTIGVAVGQVLRGPRDTLLELGWALNNASVTEILFTEGRRSLSRFNGLDHIDHDELRSYR